MTESAIAKILVVEDDAAIGGLIQDTLVEAGYACTLESDGLRALQLGLSDQFDLIILDINLPSLSGLDVCEQVKQKKPTLPILMLTARSSEADVVAGLEKGADDYVAKPFRPRELLARVRTRLKERTRRLIAGLKTQEPTAREGEAELIVIGELEFDAERMRLLKSGVAVELSAREFDFLYLLASHAGRPFSRNILLQELWDSDLEEYKSNISMFVSRLRKKIEVDADAPKYLLTVHGVGYRFVEPGELA